MENKIMRPPFEHVDFVDMKKNEAQQFFEWYTSQVQNRIDCLKENLKEDGLVNILDYSAESLISLWEWYENVIKIVPKDEDEYQREIREYPKWMKSEILTTKVSYETLKYSLDVSMYFAEVVIRNSDSKIKWGYFTSPKKRMSVNEPTLLGFKANMDLNPRLIILNCTRRSSREKLNTRLYDVFTTWMDYIE